MYIYISILNPLYPLNMYICIMYIYIHNSLQCHNETISYILLIEFILPIGSLYSRSIMDIILLIVLPWTIIILSQSHQIHYHPNIISNSYPILWSISILNHIYIHCCLIINPLLIHYKSYMIHYNATIRL